MTKKGEVKKTLQHDHQWKGIANDLMRQEKHARITYT